MNKPHYEKIKNEIERIYDSMFGTIEENIKAAPDKSD